MSSVDHLHAEAKMPLFTRHRNTVQPMVLVGNRKATLQAIHTDAVNKAVKYQKKNIMLDDLPHPNKDPEKDLTRKERAILVQLRPGHCKLLGSYKSRIKKDASLNVCADCGKKPHDVKHLFACPANPTTLIPSDIWSKPMDSIQGFSYLEAGNLDWDEPRPKVNNNNTSRYERSVRHNKHTHTNQKADTDQHPRYNHEIHRRLHQGTQRNHTSIQRQLKLAFLRVASFHPHYLTCTLQTYHHPVHRFRSWPTQMTSPSHPHKQARVQPSNTYSHIYISFLPGKT